MISPHAEGVVLSVHVQPGARKAAIVGMHGDALKITVTAPPQDGQANKAVIELLAETLEVKRAQMELLSGQTNRNKRLLVRGLSEEKVKEKVGLAVGEKKKPR